MNSRFLLVLIPLFINATPLSSFSNFSPEENVAKWCGSHDAGTMEFISKLREDLKYGEDSICETLFPALEEKSFGIYLRDGDQDKPVNLEPIQHFQNLESLSLYSEHRLENLWAVFGLEKLSYLGLSIHSWDERMFCKVRGLGSLENLRLGGSLDSIERTIACLSSPERLSQLELSVEDKNGAAEVIDLEFLTRFPNLKTLSLQCPKHENSEVKLSGFKLMGNLETLRVSYCSAGNSVLPAIPTLKTLSWTSSKIRSLGFLSTFFEFAQNLDDLDLSSNKLIEDISALSSLNMEGHLSLAWSSVKDEMLKSISHLTRLRSLDLYNTDLTGACIKDLASLKELVRLDLDECLVDDEALKNFEYWPATAKLEHLRLFYNRSGNLTGKTTDSLAHLANLNQLQICGNEIDDDGVRLLVESIPKLKWLVIRKNKYTDESLKHFGRLPHLEYLNVAGSGIDFSGAAFKDFVKSHPKTEIEPVKITFQDAVEYLDSRCSVNMERGYIGCFNGKISDDDFKYFLPIARKIKTLHLVSNQLSGEGFSLLTRKAITWESLKELVLGDNPLQEKYLQFLDAPNLEVLDVDYFGSESLVSGEFISPDNFPKLRTLRAVGTNIADKVALRLLTMASLESFHLKGTPSSEQTIEVLSAKKINLAKSPWDLRRMEYEAAEVPPCASPIGVDELTRLINIALSSGLITQDAAGFAKTYSVLPIQQEFDGEHVLIGACKAEASHHDEL